MPNLISSANFVGDVMLPNVVGTTPQAAQLTTFITKHEHRYLKDILGVEMYELFQAGLISQDTDYTEIRDGATFTDRSGIVREWLGLIDVGTSPIANYVYYQVMKYSVSQTQGVGESMSAVENGTRASSSVKMVDAWNQMVEWNRTLHEYLMVHQATFTTYIGINYPPTELYTDFYPHSTNSITAEVNQHLFKYINTWGI